RRRSDRLNDAQWGEQQRVAESQAAGEIKDLVGTAIAGSAAGFLWTAATNCRRYLPIARMAQLNSASPTNSQNVVTQNSTGISKSLQMRPLTASANPQASISIIRRSLNALRARPKRNDTI